MGLGLHFVLEIPMEKPPTEFERSQKTPAGEAKSAPQVELLSCPWFRAPPPESKPLPKPAKAPPLPPPSTPVDRTRVAFLGSYLDQSGTRVYFFKYLPTGQVMVLRPGAIEKGWTLKDISDKSFSLSGTGGLYEVAR
jgi:hypothetical protein